MTGHARRQAFLASKRSNFSLTTLRDLYTAENMRVVS